MYPRNPPAKPIAFAPVPVRRQVGRARAFSLFELLVVLAVLGVLAGVAIPYFAATTVDELQAAANVVVADFDYARGLAIANNSNYRLTFSPGQNRYQLTHVGASASLNTLPSSPFKLSSDSATTQTTRLDALPFGSNNVRLLGALRATGSTAELTDVTFTPLGSTIRSEDTLVWLGAGRGSGRSYLAVRISAVTGIATIDPLTGVVPTGMAALALLP